MGNLKTECFGATPSTKVGRCGGIDIKRVKTFGLVPKGQKVFDTATDITTENWNTAVLEGKIIPLGVDITNVVVANEGNIVDSTNSVIPQKARQGFLMYTFTVESDQKHYQSLVDIQQKVKSRYDVILVDVSGKILGRIGSDGIYGVSMSRLHVYAPIVTIDNAIADGGYMVDMYFDGEVLEANWGRSIFYIEESNLNVDELDSILKVAVSIDTIPPVVPLELAIQVIGSIDGLAVQGLDETNIQVDGVDAPTVVESSPGCYVLSGLTAGTSLITVIPQIDSLYRSEKPLVGAVTAVILEIKKKGIEKFPG